MFCQNYQKTQLSCSFYGTIYSMNTADSIKKLFGSYTRVKLLNLFLNNPQESYYVREITRLIDEQINSVRRELNNLEDIGLVQKTEKDRKVYYQLGTESGLLRPLNIIFCSQGLDDSEDDGSTVDWFDEIAGIKSSLRVLITTGAFLGDETAEVDMILVGDNTRNKISGWAQKIEKRFGQNLRYVIFDQRDFEYRLTAKDVFLSRLLSAKYEVVFNESNVTIK